MISPISTTNIVFKSYRQKFTDEEFRQRLDESVAWAKDNINNIKYLKTKKLMDKKLEKDAQNGIKLLEKHKKIFKEHNFESHIELSISGNDLIGKVSYFNSKPFEIRTQMPGSFKSFFKEIVLGAKAQKEEDLLNQEFWSKTEELNYQEALLRKRIKELSPSPEKTPNPILLLFDSMYLKRMLYFSYQ